MMELGLVAAALALMVAFLLPGFSSMLTTTKMEAAVKQAEFVHSYCDRARKQISSSSVDGFRVTHAYTHYYPSWTPAHQLSAMVGRPMPGTNALGMPIEFQMHENFCVVGTTIPFNEGNFMGHPTEPVGIETSRVVVMRSSAMKGPNWVGFQKKILFDEPMRN